MPNLTGMENMQNKTAFYLDEDDEIYEAYGKLTNSYPYRDYTCYTRECGIHPVKTAVLENEFLRAVFLPEFGGRLWRLTDLKAGRELLYTNDVIRPSNLALRDAWFSGGVEWNIGLIGHTPLTMDPLFTARLENDSGMPVLRMYEYERVRRMVYQMDFWLDEGGAFLNCRMRVVNHNPDVTPMYWWSNMAVPEYEGGRVIVPAESAYSSGGGSVYKVPVPVVDGIDISYYQNIPGQVDYFFNIPEGPRAILQMWLRTAMGFFSIPPAACGGVSSLPGAITALPRAGRNISQRKPAVMWRFRPDLERRSTAVFQWRPTPRGSGWNGMAP